ncbi:hypothetical protein EDC94DRAFT_622872 [Helicostylum pulchrum]|nr:hypothetical protein EDC94DRAFT_622872 [Helicostylum pulchrum]
MTVITQVNNNTINEKRSKQHLPSILNLSLRGSRIDMTRNTLLNLPESILIVMFPQGYVIEESSTFCKVDFNVECLNYLLDYFARAQQDFKSRRNEFEEDAYLAHAVASGIPLNPLLTKQGIVVLREELEFFVVATTTNSIMLSALKQKTSHLLVQQDLIFDTLLNTTDRHLIDMLCNAGFSTSDHWSHRSSEPNKTCICSLALVCLDKNKQSIGQKLLMFWKKPAKKCWWTKSLVTIDNEPVKLWSRRTWTLELTLL